MRRTSDRKESRRSVTLSSMPVLPQCTRAESVRAVRVTFQQRSCLETIWKMTVPACGLLLNVWIKRITALLILDDAYDKKLCFRAPAVEF